MTTAAAAHPLCVTACTTSAKAKMASAAASPARAFQVLTRRDRSAPLHGSRGLRVHFGLHFATVDDHVAGRVEAEAGGASVDVGDGDAQASAVGQGEDDVLAGRAGEHEHPAS